MYGNVISQVCFLFNWKCHRLISFKWYTYICICVLIFLSGFSIHLNYIFTNYTYFWFFSFIFSRTLSIFFFTLLPASLRILTLSWCPRQCLHLQGHFGFLSAGGSKHITWYFLSQLQQHSRHVDTSLLPVEIIKNEIYINMLISDVPQASHVLHSSQNHFPPLAMSCASSGPAFVQLRWTQAPHSEQELSFSNTPLRFLASVPKHSVHIGKADGVWNK